MILGPDACGLFLSSSARYEIGHSVRFNSADSAYFARTPGGAGNRKTLTVSFWAKRADLADSIVFFAGADANTRTNIGFSGNSLQIYDVAASSVRVNKVSSALYRDPSAWAHFLVSFDSGTIKAYVNGTEITSWGTNTNTLGTGDTSLCSATVHVIGRYNPGASSYFSGYLADVCLIDGQALTPASFGETGPAGEWRPVDARSIARGTTGFFLGFDDGSSTTTLGYDAGAGTNDWTANNFSVAAGAGNDWLADSPTNNYCTLNQIVPSAANIANGMLDSGSTAVQGTLDLSVFSAGAYWEVTAGGSNVTAGTITPGGTANTTTVTANKTFGFRLTSGGALDYINITDGGAWTGITTGLAETRFAYGTGAAANWNFGQRAFVGTASGSALCTKNLPEPSIAKASQYFNVKTYTGTGSSLALTGVGHQPDLVWIKSRSAATDHAIYDDQRFDVSNNYYRLESNNDGMEADEISDGVGLGVDSFDADGFTLGTLAQVNTNAATYAAWCMKESAASGIDIRSGSKTGTGAQAFTHALGVKPEMILVKRRSSGLSGWYCAHKSFGTNMQDYYALLNSSAAAVNSSAFWGGEPTSSNFTISNSICADGGSFIAYLFASVPGFSQVGSFLGNASADGPFVWCGFRPRWVLYKNAGATQDWLLRDAVRDTENPCNAALWPDLAGAESASGSELDFLANGFKPRSSGITAHTYIFLAFAECPFKYANAR